MDIDADRVEALKARVCAEVDRIADRLLDASHEIHAHPELNFEEVFAHDLLSAILDDSGLGVTRHAYGVATAFEFEVDEVGNVGFAQLVLDASDTAGFLQRWGAAVEAAPRDLTSFLIMGPPRRGQPMLAHVLALGVGMAAWLAVGLVTLVAAGVTYAVADRA